MSICERQSGGRILCIRLSGLGDVVHALNALALLRRERPHAHITWLVEDRFSNLLRGHPHVDELIAVPRRRWGAMMRNPLRWKRLAAEVRSLWRRLRDADFDICVDFQSSLKSTWLVQASGAALKVGFDRPVNREWNHLFQNHLVRVPHTAIHRVERNLALLAPLGVPTRYARPVLRCSPENAAALDRDLEGRLSGGPMVVIHPGTSEFAAFKRWLPARYASVADHLVEDRRADVVVTWGPEDRHLAEEVVLLMKRPGILAPPTENLQQLVHLINRADLFIGSDTGPMHIASALGVPVVALFGPKDPGQTGPYCSRHLVVTGKAPCRPCTRRRCSHVRCMTSISSGQVTRAARRVLAGQGEPAAGPGPIRRGASWRFALGPWRGEMNSAYSSPEFFTWLCAPDALASADGTELLPAARTRMRLSVEFGEPGLASHVPARRFVLERLAGWRRRARRAWRSAVRLTEAGAPVLCPVCHMSRWTGGGRDQLLMVEQWQGAEPLAVWLSRARRLGEGPRGRALLAEIARAVRELHRARFLHGNLSPQTVFVGLPEDGAPQARVLVTDCTRWVGWLPLMARVWLCGRELAGLLAALDRALSERDRALLLQHYRRGFIDGEYSRRTLEHALQRQKETGE